MAVTARTGMARMLPHMRPAARKTFLVLSTTVALAACSPGGSGGAAPAPEPVPAPASLPSLEPTEGFATSRLTLRGPDGEAIEVPVYVASTPEQRSRGLMDREDLPDGTGMVFTYDADTSGAYYMYRTLMPLSIAFYDADGRIAAVLDMEPCTSATPSDCELYDPGVTYRGALEVEQGWFAARGVGEGWTVDLPDDLPAAP